MSTRLALVAALFALALPGSAAAAPAISNVSSPGDHSRLLYDRQAASTVHLAGTANFPVADVYCLSLESDGSKRFDVVLANVPVTSGTFDVPQASLALVAGRLCRWIALPSGVVPGTLNDASLAQVTGPVVATSTIDRRRSLLSGGPNDGQPYKWYALAQGFNGGFDFVSPGNGGLYDDFLQDPATLRRANPMFFGNSGLYYDDVPDGSDHSELVADEIDAYDRYGAVQLYNPGGAVGSRSEDAVHLPADELESLTIDPATGDVTVRARSDIAVCTGSTDAAIPHPTPGQSNTTTCPDFASAGLRLEQVYTQSHEGNLTLQQLRFVSTDGKPHHLDWWPAQAIQVDDAPSYQPSFLMAWLSGDFQTFGSGAAPAAPTASPASIDVKGNSTAADGDPAFAVGTMIFSQAPSGLRFDDENNIYDAGYFETHLVRDVPAGGAAQFTFAYADGFTRAAVQPLAAEALAALTFGLTLDGPADGSTTKLSPATVTGHLKEGGNGMPATVKVNGADTPVDANGAFSANVALKPGKNTLTVQAADPGGQTATASRTVTYAPLAITTVGKPKVKRTTVTIPLSCAAGGATCAATIGLSARKPKAKRAAATKVFKAGKRSFSVPAGTKKRIKVKLNKAAVKALKRARKLAVTLKVTTVEPAGTPPQVKRKKVTFKIRRRRR